MLIRAQRLTVPLDDNDSIAGLSKTTSHCFDTDKVRLLYIRAQVTRIDLKIDLALCEVMRRYKRLIGSSTGWSFAVGGSTINQKVSINKATKAIINCFGLPTVSADVAMESLKANVWSTLGTNMTLALAETLQVVGVLGSVALAGIPVWTVSGGAYTNVLREATMSMLTDCFTFSSSQCSVHCTGHLPPIPNHGMRPYPGPCEVFQRSNVPRQWTT